MCEHENIEFGDDDERGLCTDCGLTCTWHWESDFDEYETQNRVVDNWGKVEDDL